MSIGVLLAGSRQLFRAGLARILESDRFRVTGEVHGLHDLAALPEATDVVIVDAVAGMGDIDDGVRRLKELAPPCRVIVIAADIDHSALVNAFAAGADGYLLDDISPAALRESVRLVLVGEHVFPSQIVALLRGIRRETQAALPVLPEGSLSEREAEIVMRLAGGLPNKVIASELTITEATVKVHLKSILRKLGVSNRTQAAVWAISSGMAPPPQRPAA